MPNLVTKERLAAKVTGQVRSKMPSGACLQPSEGGVQPIPDEFAEWMAIFPNNRWYPLLGPPRSSTMP